MKKNKVEVRLSKIEGAGLGLFAKTKIKKGDLISEFTGKLVRNDDSEYWSQKEEFLYLIFWDENHKLDVEPSDCLAKYANDAVGLKKTKGLKNKSKIVWHDDRLFLMATKDINREDEVYVSYGKQYWKEYSNGL
jgi:hypothetical protein